MFKFNDCVKLVDVTDDILEEVAAERFQLEGKFWLIQIDGEEGVEFPYLIQHVDDENLIFWVGKDEIEYA